MNFLDQLFNVSHLDLAIKMNIGRFFLLSALCLWELALGGDNTLSVLPFGRPMSNLCQFFRTPAHCIEYAHLVLWPQQRQGEEFDADLEEHMQWVYKKAAERATLFGIQAGVVALSLSGLFYSCFKWFQYKHLPKWQLTNADGCWLQWICEYMAISANSLFLCVVCLC